MPLRSFTEAEIVLKARRRLERPLLATVWLGVVMFSLWRANYFYLAAATLAVGVNLFAVHRAKEVYVHQFIVNVGVLVATGILLLEVFGRPGELQLLVKLGNYLILIQLCKLFERKKNRDYVQMLVLSPLLVVAATLYCSQLWFALLLGAYGALLCYTGMVFTLKRSLDAAAGAQLAMEAGPLSPRRVAWNAIRDWPGGALIGRTASAMAGMLLVGVIVFLAAPRTHAGGTGTDPLGGVTESGYTSTGRLGQPRRVYLSDRIAMTVKRISAPRQARPVIYLRGKTFSRYADSCWTNRTPPRRPAPSLPPPQDLLAAAEVLEISLVPRHLPALFVPPGTVHLVVRQGEARVNPQGEALLSLPRPPEGNVHYTTYSFPHPRSAPQRRSLARRRASPPVEPSLWQMFRSRFAAWRDPPRPLHRAPPRSAIRPRVRQLAETWCADLLRARQAGTISRERFSLDAARRIAQKLQQRCTYTLDLSGVDPARDAVEDFLFHTKRGHCEYFASALTVMCQALEIDARWATGFVAGGVDSAGTRVYVRDRDAHAWTEVYTSQTSWQVVDASPARPGDEAGGLWGWAKGVWQKLGFLWDEHVLGYDTEARRRIGRWLWDTGARLVAAVRSAAGAIGRSVVRLLAHGEADRVLGWTALGTALIALVLEAALVLRLVGQRLRRRRAHRARPSPRDVRFIQELFDLLIRHGLVVRTHQTPRQLADQAAAAMDLPARMLQGLIDLYYRLRWGGQAAADQEIRAAEGRVAQVRQMLARRAKS